MYYGECPEHGVVKTEPVQLTVEEGKKVTVFQCPVENCGTVELQKVRFVHYTDTSLAEDYKRHCDVRCVVGTVSCNCKCGGLCHGLGRCICGN